MVRCCVTLSTPPKMGVPVTTTRHVGGTMISIPPKIAVALNIAERAAMLQSRRSSSIPPNTAVSSPPMSVLDVLRSSAPLNNVVCWMKDVADSGLSPRSPIIRDVPRTYGAISDTPMAISITGQKALQNPPGSRSNLSSCSKAPRLNKMAEPVRPYDLVAYCTMAMIISSIGQYMRRTRPKCSTSKESSSHPVPNTRRVSPIHRLEPVVVRMFGASRFVVMFVLITPQWYARTRQ